MNIISEHSKTLIGRDNTTSMNSENPKLGTVPDPQTPNTNIQFKQLYAPLEEPESDHPF